MRGVDYPGKSLTMISHRQQLPQSLNSLKTIATVLTQVKMEPENGIVKYYRTELKQKRNTNGHTIEQSYNGNRAKTFY